MKLQILLAIIAFGMIPCSIVSATTMSLDQYLKEVENNNQAMRGSSLLLKSAQLKASESSLLFKPNFFAQAQTLVDKKPTANKSFQGDQTDYSLVTLGFMQQFRFGLQGKLSYALSHTKLHNATFLNPNDYHDGIANIELSQSLWRNFLGRESRAQETIVNASSKATLYGEQFKIKATRAQAQALFWSLSQMQKIVKVQKESLERAQKIRTWAQNRLRTGLGESSDFLQADANFKAREFELKSTLQEQANLQRSFNSLRGVQSEQLSEILDSISSEQIKALNLPKKIQLREDTLAAAELQKIATATAKLAQEKNKPTFELFGSYSLNGRGTQSSDALSQSTKSNHDTRAIGVRFNAPLDFVTTGDNIKAYQQEVQAQALNYERKLFDQEKEWNDLIAKFEDAKTKLQLIEKIEEAQKAKVINERDRLSKGRTVTFQVLNFEQDYAQSELARIQTETAILNLYSQLSIFEKGEF